MGMEEEHSRMKAREKEKKSDPLYCTCYVTRRLDVKREREKKKTTTRKNIWTFAVKHKI